MSTKKSKFLGLFETPGEIDEGQVESLESQSPVQTAPATVEEKNSRNQANKNSRNEESKNSRDQERRRTRAQEPGIERKKTNYELRKDYVAGLKKIAADEDRPIYEIIEEALQQYLMAKGRL